MGHEVINDDVGQAHTAPQALPLVRERCSASVQIRPKLCCCPPLQDRVEKVQVALQELTLEKERLLLLSANLQAELQARAAPVPLSAAMQC